MYRVLKSTSTEAFQIRVLKSSMSCVLQERVGISSVLERDREKLHLPLDARGTDVQQVGLLELLFLRSYWSG